MFKLIGQRFLEILSLIYNRSAETDRETSIYIPWRQSNSFILPL